MPQENCNVSSWQSTNNPNTFMIRPMEKVIIMFTEHNEKSTIFYFKTFSGRNCFWRRTQERVDAFSYEIKLKIRFCVVEV